MINDGSSDNSLERLEWMQKNDFPIEIISQPNMGHGPAILNGYTRASNATWVFQIDADHQLDPSAFADLWQHRDQYDFLIAERCQKNASLVRNIVSSVSRLLVQLIFGKGVQDVNSPYRLLRSSVLAELIPFIPEKSFAPNVLLTAYFVFKHKKIYNTTVSFNSTAIVRKSKMNVYILKGSLKSLFQTIMFRFRL